MNRPLSLLLASALCSLAPLPARAADPELPESGLALFQSRFTALEKSYDSSLASYATRIERNKDPDDGEKLELSVRLLHLAYHRELLILETDLVSIATPGDEPDPDRTPDDISSPEFRRVASLRQDIRDSERERITEALEKGVALHSDERAAKSIYRDQKSLDSLFDRANSGHQREIDKARRSIGREQKSSRPDDDEIAELEQKIETAEAAVAELHQFFYGYKPGTGFDQVPDWPAGHPAELLRTAIRSARDAVLKQLREDAGQGGEDSAKGGLVGGSYIYSANLGVVLDVSGSMTPHIEALKKEIADTFSGPRYGEISGCRLSSRSFNLNGDLSAALRIHDTMSVIEELIAIHRIDTLYWFTDLRDDRDIQSLRRLRSLLRRCGTAFHVKSVDRSPDRELKPLIDDFQQ